MTIKELSQLYNLNEEVRMLQSELDRMRSKSLIGSQRFDGMPPGGALSDPTANAAVTEADIEAIIRGRLAEIQIQRKRIIEYINSVDDSLVRQILFYRHVSCMTWVRVAMEVGGGNTPDGVRMIHNRFVKKNKSVRFVRL